MSKISPHRKISAVRYTDGKPSTVEAQVITEKDLQVYINGSRLATASMAPGMEKEFVAGYLYGQGFIGGMEDIVSLEIADNAAQVTLKNKALTVERADYRIVTGGGRMAYSKDSSISKIESDITIDKDTIFQSMNVMFEQASMYKETEGAHAAGLFDKSGKALCIVEDIGRHNTLDKTIGYILLNNINASNAFLTSTGRMASEMVTKICRCGIPIVATKTAVTDKGIEIAERNGLTLIGFVRDAGTKINTDMDVRVIKEAGMKIYTGASRINCQ